VILDLDIGNTRIKWRLSTAAGPVRGGAVDNRAGPEALPVVGEQVQRIRVANVAGPRLRAAVDRWAEMQWSLKPEYARVESACQGVTCGYRDPAQLGVDRWLVVLAAWHECRDNCLVVDAGSALTVDIVMRDGCHSGGFIVPGLWLMHKSLSAATAGVRVDAEAPAMPLLPEPGHCTEDAVRHGCLAMAVSFIGRCLDYLPGGGRLYMTGGDASVLAPYLASLSPPVLRPELVLDGLVLALDGGGAKAQ